MTLTDIINLVLSGGLLGALGQGIRVAVGLKKLNEANVANASSTKPKEEFSGNRLLLSIFIGFVAGAIGMLIKQPPVGSLDTQFIVTIIASGYAGADFIEGFFNTTLSKVVAPTPPADGAATTSSNPTQSGNSSVGDNADIPVG